MREDGRDRPPLTEAQLELWLESLKNCPLSLRLNSESDFDALKDTIKLPDEIENYFQRKENELKSARIEFERTIFQEQNERRQLNSINKTIDENSDLIKALLQQNKKLNKEKEDIEKKLKEFSLQKESMKKEMLSPSNQGLNDLKI